MMEHVRKGMAMKSEEERRREMEEEDRRLFMPGLTYGEYRRLMEREQHRACQKLTQLPATVLGYWKSCSLSPCRRAKRCKGFLTEAQYEERYHRACPPCVGKSVERHAEIVKTLNALVERAKELQRAREEKGRT
jgi:hypothetical protein